MAKFNVGDEVVGNKMANERYLITNEGCECKVVKIYNHGCIDVKLKNDGCVYHVHEDYFDLKESVQSFKEGDTVKLVYADLGDVEYHLHEGMVGKIINVDYGDETPYLVSFENWHHGHNGNTSEYERKINDNSGWWLNGGSIELLSEEQREEHEESSFTKEELEDAFNVASKEIVSGLSNSATSIVSDIMVVLYIQAVKKIVFDKLFGGEE